MSSSDMRRPLKTSLRRGKGSCLRDRDTVMPSKNSDMTFSRNSETSYHPDLSHATFVSRAVEADESDLLAAERLILRMARSTLSDRLFRTSQHLNRHFIILTRAWALVQGRRRYCSPCPCSKPAIPRPVSRLWAGRSVHGCLRWTSAPRQWT